MRAPHFAITSKQEGLSTGQEERSELSRFSECRVQFERIARRATRSRYTLDWLVLLAEEDHASVAPGSVVGAGVADGLRRLATCHVPFQKLAPGAECNPL